MDSENLILLIEDLFTLHTGWIAQAELRSPFFYPFISGCCSSGWKNSRNQFSTLAIMTIFTVLHVKETDFHGLLHLLSPLQAQDQCSPQRSSAAPVSVLILQADWGSTLLQGTKELVAGTALEHQHPQTLFAGFLWEMMTQKQL